MNQPEMWLLMAPEDWTPAQKVPSCLAQNVWCEIYYLISYKMQRVPHPLFLNDISIIISIINVDGSKTLA